MVRARRWSLFCAPYQRGCAPPRHAHASCGSAHSRRRRATGEVFAAREGTHLVGVAAATGSAALSSTGPPVSAAPSGSPAICASSSPPGLTSVSSTPCAASRGGAASPPSTPGTGSAGVVSSPPASGTCSASVTGSIGSATGRACCCQRGISRTSVAPSPKRLVAAAAVSHVERTHPGRPEAVPGDDGQGASAPQGWQVRCAPRVARQRRRHSEAGCTRLRDTRLRDALVGRGCASAPRARGLPEMGRATLPVWCLPRARLLTRVFPPLLTPQR